MLTRRLTLAAPALLAFPVAAQTYPTKPIKIIVPFPAGQSTDILARVMADQLTKALGQQVIAENRPGAGGSIGADAAAKAAPDGYTLLMVTISTHGIAPAIYPKLPYDAQKDFAPIANIGLTPQVLMASLKSGITSVQDLLAKAKAGADLNYGSSGNGSASHLAVEMLKSAAGIKLTHVPFKGNADALMALQSGDIQLLSDAVPGAVGPINTGKVKAIGIADQRRSPFLPDVPTIAEQGIQGVVAVGWIGLSAPADSRPACGCASRSRATTPASTSAPATMPSRARSTRRPSSPWPRSTTPSRRSPARRSSPTAAATARSRW